MPAARSECMEVRRLESEKTCHDPSIEQVADNLSVMWGLVCEALCDTIREWDSGFRIACLSIQPLAMNVIVITDISIAMPGIPIISPLVHQHTHVIVALVVILLLA